MHSIGLFGSETWSLTEALRTRLRTMQAYHLRVMCRVTRVHVREQEITTRQLSEEIGVAPIDVYIDRRQLRYLGHVARMPPERYPRRMLSSWREARVLRCKSAQPPLRDSVL